MLVLSRKMNERILIDGQIRLTVLGLRGNQVRIGIEAPPEIKVVREELLLAPRREPVVMGESGLATTSSSCPERAPAPLAAVLEKYHASDVS